MNTVIAIFCAGIDGSYDERRAQADKLFDRLEADSMLIVEPSSWNYDYEYRYCTDIKALVSEELFFELSMTDNIAAKPIKRMAESGASASSVAKQVSNKQAGPGDRREAFNEKVEVHVPGFALTTYNRTMLLGDSCTDELQAALDQGWRIIACCPQPNSRRPDYILGRYEAGHMVRVENGHSNTTASRHYDLDPAPSNPVDVVRLDQPNIIPQTTGLHVNDIVTIRSTAEASEFFGVPDSLTIPF